MNIGALLATHNNYKPIYYFKTNEIKITIPILCYGNKYEKFYDIDHFKTWADSDYSGFKSFLIKYEE